jgi:hypothetical protein
LCPAAALQLVDVVLKRIDLRTLLGGLRAGRRLRGAQLLLLELL